MATIPELTAQAVDGDRGAVTEIRELFLAGLGGDTLEGTDVELAAAITAVVELGERYIAGDDDTPFDSEFPPPWHPRNLAGYVTLVETIKFAAPKKRRRKSDEDGDE